MVVIRVVVVIVAVVVIVVVVVVLGHHGVACFRLLDAQDAADCTQELALRHCGVLKTLDHASFHIGGRNLDPGVGCLAIEDSLWNLHCSRMER